MTQFRRSKDLQKEDLKRRMNKKPMGQIDTKSTINRRREPIRSKTDNPMGKDRVRDRKMKNIRDMRERRESLRQNKKPEPIGGFRKPKNPKGTGAPMGGFRKPKFNPKTLSEKGTRKVKSRMTGGDSTGKLFPNVYKVKK